MERYAELSIFRHLLAPLGAVCLLFVLAYGTKADFTLALALFDMQGGAWSLQHHWLTETLLHNHVRTVNETLIAALLGYWVWRRAVLKDQSQKQKALGRLLLSLLLSFATVAVLKRLLPMECPWDLQQFGGNNAFWGLFDTRPAMLAANQCFPAGHASIGFAWLALYYYWYELQPKRAWQGLLIGLGAGLLLGFVQQLRGAHFMSHDIATAAVCWLIPTLLYLQFKRRHTVKVTLSATVPVKSAVYSAALHSVESSDV